MDEKHRYITARIKTQKQIEKVYPSAKYWGGPRSPNYLCRSACESLLPYLGKTVLVRKIRLDIYRTYYEIKDTGGLRINANWIDFFDSENFVPAVEWKDPNWERFNDIWLDPLKKRYIIIDDIVIVTG